MPVKEHLAAFVRSTMFKWMLGVALATYLIWLAGGGNRERTVLLAALAIAAFILGAAAGFVFTSYDAESSTVGKVKDWLVGGLAGLSIAKAASVKSLLMAFAAGPRPADYALVVAVSASAVGLGFFAMFFQRELILNVLLAEGRARRGRIENTKAAGLVAWTLLNEIPASVLSGIDDIDELIASDSIKSSRLTKALTSEAVGTFLREAEEAIARNVPLDWDSVSKAAILHYYLSYFSKDSAKEEELRLAHAWITRALVLNPLHIDLRAKLADVLFQLGEANTTVSILRDLNSSKEAPAYIKQWLGYYLLKLGGHEDESISISQDFHRQFPSESDALFNIAAAHAVLYANELKAMSTTEFLSSQNRSLCLSTLREALRACPSFKESVKTGPLYSALRNDAEFLELVSNMSEQTSTAAVLNWVAASGAD